jgi:hypothetical protein
VVAEAKLMTYELKAIYNALKSAVNWGLVAEAKLMTYELKG